MPPPAPASPNPEFDFMLKANPQAKKSLLPSFSRPMKIGLGIVVGIILLVIISSHLSKGNSFNTSSITVVLARDKEVLRVTKLAQQLGLQNPETLALASTVSTSMTSNQQRLGAYLTKNHAKVSVIALAADLNKSSDAILQTAQQNNGLDAAYKSYVKDALSKYQGEVQTAYTTAGPVGKTILKDSIDSTKVLLSSSLLANS